MWTLGLLLQLVDADAPPAITIPNFADEAQCPPAADGEIVVCAKSLDPDKYRLPVRSGNPDDPIMPPAEVRLFGNVRAGAAVQSVGHFDAPAATVTIKVPF